MLTPGVQTLTISPQTSISADLGAGDDRLVVDASLSDALADGGILTYVGGAGQDSLAGPSLDSSWIITGEDSGTLGNVGFAGVENLFGAADNEDTFVFGPGGSLSGTVSGGDGGFDTIQVSGSYKSVQSVATGADSGVITLDSDELVYDGMEPIVFDGTLGLYTYLGSSGDDSIVVTSYSPGHFMIDGVGETIVLTSVDSLLIDALGGDDSVTFQGGAISFGGADLEVRSESIIVAADALIESVGNVTFTALVENNITASTSPDAIDIGAQVLVEGDMNVTGSLILDATVNNTVDLDASDVSLVVESQSTAIARIGSTAQVNADNLVVSAVTNTNFSIDITDAAGGASGIGADIVDADRGVATLLQEDGPAGFYLWGSADLDTNAATYVVTHGWRDGLPFFDSWIDSLNAIRIYDPDANVIFTDWNDKAGNLNYPQAAYDTYEIGGLLADFLANSAIDPSTTTLIGHSLGGHVSGIAADRYEIATGNPIAQVIALDPAGPFFEETLGFDAKPLERRLDASDADRVVALHTTSILGYEDSLADMDLYVNPDSPFQPGQTDFAGNHSYPVDLLIELMQGESFSQTSGNLVGDDLEYADLLDSLLLGSADVATYATPIQVTTTASIEGGAQIIVGTTPISATEPASVLVQAVDNSNLQSMITTGTIVDLTDYDFIQSKIGLNRDTRAYIGGESGRTTLSNVGDTATGIVKVSAQNLGNVAGEVSSDFLDYKSSTFSRENAIAYVENAELNVEGLEVVAGSSSDYTATAEENNNTVRGFVEAYVDTSIVTAGAAGVTLSALDDSSYTVISEGQGGRMSLNDIRTDVSAYVTDSTLTVTDGPISISADNQTTLSATATLSTSDSNFAASDIFAINVANGDVNAYAENSILATTLSGDISLTANNNTAIDARVKGDATAGSLGLVLNPVLTFGAAMAFNAVGWDMSGILMATLDDFLGDLSSDWIETILPMAESTPTLTRAYLLDTDVDAAGDLTVHATSAPQINATVSNAAETTASSLYGALGASAGFVLASNKVNSEALASIDYSDTYAHVPGEDDVSTGGTISVQASDDAGIYSNVKIVSSSITTSDGGANVLNDIIAYFTHDYTSDDTPVSLEFGKRVMLADDYAGGGTPGRVYQYMGTEAAWGTRQLDSENYNDVGWWKEILETELVPQGNNLTRSDSISVGGLVALNEVNSDVLAKIANATVKTFDGDVQVSATENAAVIATSDATAVASGGSAYGSGIVIAGGGVLAANSILSQADAYLADSVVVASDSDLFDEFDLGNIVLEASNTSLIDATVLNSVTSGDTAGGITLAFNTVGWDSQSILFQTIDALIGTEIGAEEKAGVRAYALDSTLTADGDISVTAASDASINADVGNEATAAASALYGATSVAISALLASNMVSSEAQADIRYSDTYVHPTVDVQAGGSVTVQANENASITASTRMLAKGSSSNDGGASIVNNFVNAFLDEYDYTTKSGTQTISQFDKVRLASDYAGGNGSPGAVYQYTGSDEPSLDLGGQNYASGLWVRLDSTNIIPAFGNVSGSSSVAVGGLVVRNDVRGGVDAHIDQATVRAVDLSVSALENATIFASTLSAAEAAGGSAYGTGTVIAGNGSAVTNLVLSHADAYITDSNITTLSGDLSVTAQNTSQLDATLLSSTDSGDAAIGVVLAFNSVGWESQNMLLSALDALIGRPLDDIDYLIGELLEGLDPGDRVRDTNNIVYRYIGEQGHEAITLASGFHDDASQWVKVRSPYGNEDPARVRAYILDSTIKAAGDVSITAENEAQVNATVSNAASSAASALINANGAAFGGILASNKVASTAEAYIDYSVGYVHPTLIADVEAGGDVTILAQDNAGIYANTRLVSSSVTSNDGGVGLLGSAVDDVIPTEFCSDDGTVDIVFGQRVRLADEFGDSDFSSTDGQVDILQGQYVELSDDYSEPTFTSDSGVRLLRSGDVVELSSDYDDSRGDGGALYRFVGIGSRGLRVDLEIEDYTDASLWQEIGGTSGGVYEYLGANDPALDLELQDYSDEDLWREVNGSPGEIYIYMGPGEIIDVSSADYGDIGLWKLDPITQAVPDGLNFTPSNSIAIGGLVVLNDVRSGVEAFINDATVRSGGSVGVQALESAVIRAETDAATSSSGGDAFGKGISLAVNAVVATNLVLSTSEAYIDASDITTTTLGVDGLGDINIDAENISQIDATTRSVSTSGANAASFLLAFNTVGFRAQNLLFNTLDALLARVS